MWIIGGATLYRQGIDELRLSEMHAITADLRVLGDAVAPALGCSWAAEQVVAPTRSSSGGSYRIDRHVQGRSAHAPHRAGQAPHTWGAMTASTATHAPSRAASSGLQPGQLVEFYRPSPRGGRLACQGVVESVKLGSVLVHCTDSPVIGLSQGTLLRLSAQELRAL